MKMVAGLATNASYTITRGSLFSQDKGEKGAGVCIRHTTRYVDAFKNNLKRQICGCQILVKCIELSLHPFYLLSQQWITKTL